MFAASRISRRVSPTLSHSTFCPSQIEKLPRPPAHSAPIIPTSFGLHSVLPQRVTRVTSRKPLCFQDTREPPRMYTDQLRMSLPLATNLFSWQRHRLSCEFFRPRCNCASLSLSLSPDDVVHVLAPKLRGDLISIFFFFSKSLHGSLELTLHVCGSIGESEGWGREGKNIAQPFELHYWVRMVFRICRGNCYDIFSLIMVNKQKKKWGRGKICLR